VRYSSAYLQVHPATWKPIHRLSKEYGFRIIEDASIATGAKYQGNHVAAAHSVISVFSVFILKIITSAKVGIGRSPTDEQLVKHMKTHSQQGHNKVT